MVHDEELCYRAVRSRDARFDGWFFVGVTSTGIFCRPSCPATTPRRANLRYFPTAGAARHAGFRACRRCRPDTAPGSPDWDLRADLAGRAMRLINDGVVDREGVPGLARRLAVGPRHLHRLLTAELGAGPLALARARRAQMARVLIETTTLPLGQVAFAAGFASIRQFNDTVREMFGASPSTLRRDRASAIRRGRSGGPPDGAPPGSSTGGPVTLSLRLATRQPFAGPEAIAFLAARAVPGLEAPGPDGAHRRVLTLPHGAATVSLLPHGDHVEARLRLLDLRDLGAAVERCRRLLDLDADPVAVDDVLGSDPLLAPLVAATPGRRSPGAVDGAEALVRAIVGQQISVPGARTVTGRLVAALGTPLDPALAEPDGALTRSFPAPEAVAEADPAILAMPASRAAALRSALGALAAGTLVLDPGADRPAVEAALVRQRGIGPWTASYLALRALGDPDVFLPTDLGVRRALAARGGPADERGATARAARWRPWRSYAVHHLWAAPVPSGAPGAAGDGVQPVSTSDRSAATTARSARDQVTAASNPA